MRYRIQLLFLLIGSVLIGCNPKYYVPNTQNVPVITSKGQTDLTAAGNANQLEFLGAYGLTKNIAIQVNATRFSPGTEDNGDGGTGNFVEAGIGYYTNISPSFVFSTYGLAGVGSIENQFPRTVDENPATTGNISANATRFGVQPVLTYHSKYVSVSGSTRLMNLNYSNVEGNLIFDGEDQVNYLTENRSNILLEPGITVRGGLERIKLQLQLLQSINLSNSDFKQDNTLLTIGVNFRFE
ncbi:hypothetical protein [Rhodohalobacter sp. 614A]|uniref:hypothetical protein n=1 Tax=Rhodohalobacter sp. 614A TaxID=2908649 RepID=UPI001F456314|nr:hypothetical protein [Rhodohalobacter sp. 614A]